MDNLRIIIIGFIQGIDIKAISEITGAFPSVALIIIGIGLGSIFSRFVALEKRVKEMHQSNTYEIRRIRNNIHLMYRWLVLHTGSRNDPTIEKELDIESEELARESRDEDRRDKW